MREYFSKKSVLITGGAGSIGSSLATSLLGLGTKSVTILDNDENALFMMRLTSDIQYSKGDRQKLSFVLGDCRDKSTVESVAKNKNIILHLAALKHLTIGNEYPFEVVKTNILGTNNFVEAVLSEVSVVKFILLSTDKAVYPSSLYGATKLIAEQITLKANERDENKSFGVIRLGNVIGTRGSMYYVWGKEQKAGCSLRVTDRRMKRFLMTMNEAVSFIIKSTAIINREEIIIPKMKEYKIFELARELSTKIEVTQPFHGEKFSEKLMTDEEHLRAEEYEDCWVIRK